MNDFILNNKRILIISGLIIISIFFVVLALLLGNSNILKQTTFISNKINPAPLPSVLPSSTPMPFEELTIPYLRNRNYSSKLGNLELVSNNGSYNSYLTNYDSDGLKINGLLTRPTGQEPQGGWPAIVFVHGYLPPRSYNTLSQSYSSYVDHLARNGFVVFKIDLRGHGTSEGEPGGAYYSSDYVIDTLNAYSALQNADFINKNGIGLWGHSMAGNVISRSMAAKPDIPAVVIWAGAGFSYVDLNTYGISDASYQPSQAASTSANRRQSIRELYGNPKDGNPFWQKVAFTNYLNDLKGAISLHHAVDDNVVSVEYSRNLNNLLNDTFVEHELNEYPSGGHNISGSNFSAAMQRTVDFYKKHLN